MKSMHWIGIDDHADKWTIAHLVNDESRPADEFELVPNEFGYRKLIAFAKSLKGEVRIVYEAGPCGYELYRRLTKARLHCQVAAPSLTPVRPGQRVKTNRRDAAKLSGYLRSNELTFISVPDEARESLRDLVPKQAKTVTTEGSSDVNGGWESIGTLPLHRVVRGYWFLSFRCTACSFGWAGSWLPWAAPCNLRSRERVR